MIPSRLKLRWRRKRLLWRSFRSRHVLSRTVDRTSQIREGDILAVMCVRNERDRLPFVLAHHRTLGIAQFLIIDNDSTDGTAAYLADQPDVSLWSTQASYRAARFGLDWMTYLQWRYAHRHWCLMLDADEVLVYDGWEDHPLPALTAHLDRLGQRAFGALMLDLFPKGPLDQGRYSPGDDPAQTLPWFDSGPYRSERQKPLQNLWLQGGTRDRVFFADRPARAPTLNKLPLVRWTRDLAYVNSCHSILPPALNLLYDGPGEARPAGVLLHSKFLPGITQRSGIEKERKQHFNRPEAFDRYYDQIRAAPDLWHPGALRYDGAESLIRAGLMPRIDWTNEKGSLNLSR